VRRPDGRDGTEPGFWIPVFEILEQRGFEVMVVNAGREACAWAEDRRQRRAMAQRLHEYGLLRSSFRPEAEIAALRTCPR
jgi:transposase